jgi:hypothetical protein
MPTMAVPCGAAFAGGCCSRRGLIGRRLSLSSAWACACSITHRVSLGRCRQAFFANRPGEPPGGCFLGDGVSVLFVGWDTPGGGASWQPSRVCAARGEPSLRRQRRSWRALPLEFSLRGRAFVRLVPHDKAVSSQGGPFPLLRNQRGQGQEGSSALPIRHQGVTCGRAIKTFPQASAFPATRRVCFERGVVPRPCRAGLESPRGVGDGPDGSSGLGRLSG